MMAGKRKSSVPPRNNIVEQNGKPTEYVDRKSMELKKREEEAALKSSNYSGLLLVCFLGIFVSYFIYGILQETM